MMRSGPVLLALAGAAALVPAAIAATPTQTHVGVDHTHAVKFSLTGQMLTVTLQPVDGAPNPLIKRLPGSVLDTACSGKTPTGKAKVLAAKLSVAWPKKTTAITVQLDKDVSAHVKWCVIEHQDTGADIALSEKMRVPNPSAPPAN